MKKRIKHNGYYIYIKTINNIEGSICNISTRIRKHFSIDISGYLDSKVVIWNDNKQPRENISFIINDEIDRLIKEQKRIINNFNIIK